MDRETLLEMVTDALKDGVTPDTPLKVRTD